MSDEFIFVTGIILIVCVVTMFYISDFNCFIRKLLGDKNAKFVTGDVPVFVAFIMLISLIDIIIILVQVSNLK